MITFHTSAEIPSDRRVVLNLPSDTPTGKVDLVVTIAPHVAPPLAGGNLRSRFGTVHSGDSRSADNERIDADLARACEDAHD
jgi:hypothetical protein